MHDLAPIWRASAAGISSSAMHRVTLEAERIAGRRMEDYDALWRWSVDAPGHFWSLIWSFCGVVGDRGERRGELLEA